MKKMRAPSKTTTQALLVLLSTPKGLHGYDITRSTGIGPGTLYPMLARLEDQGMLASEWESSEEHGRPPRRVYSLTDAGKAFAEGLETDQPKSSGVPKPA
ncbi:MAG: PadR family transcriptional regulator [Parasphingorhabdus sp.]